MHKMVCLPCNIGKMTAEGKLSCFVLRVPKQQVIEVFNWASSGNFGVLQAYCLMGSDDSLFLTRVLQSAKLSGCQHV